MVTEMKYIDSEKNKHVNHHSLCLLVLCGPFVDLPLTKWKEQRLGAKRTTFWFFFHRAVLLPFFFFPPPKIYLFI